MEDLRAVVGMLRREIEIALEDEEPLPAGVRLEAETVTLALNFHLVGVEVTDASEKMKRRCQVAIAPEKTDSGHSLTVTFRIRRTPLSSIGAPRSNGSEGANRVSRTREEAMVDRCAEVFGLPGFDNAARAEVFSDLAVKLAPEDLDAALTCVADGVPVTREHPQSGTISRLRQLLSFAPVGCASAAATLRQMIRESSIREVVELLAAGWRFGTHWSIAPTSPEGPTD